MREKEKGEEGVVARLKMDQFYQILLAFYGLKITHDSLNCITFSFMINNILRSILK